MINVSFEQRIAKMKWEASAHTQPGRGARVDDATLAEASARFESGAYAEVVERMERAEHASRDPKALVLLGLAHLALDEYSAAVGALDEAWRVLAEDLAKVGVNRALALSLLARHEEALAACDAARAVVPHLWSVPLAEIVVRERRQGPGDETRVEHLLVDIPQRWRDWRTTPIARYLALDGDYAALRAREDGAFFERTLGVSVEALRAELRREAESTSTK